ncbi:DUF1236 domain-containing protein [Aureimonas populi]|uniref:DUF1236 domain-containing protein n=1 Tax=Aureimonas populi TaxID=1701758 RepID=A0ABW5CR80_9HYPH|nr:DUF1236 domain-containing protein [Aureimonas populi]
MTFGGKFAMGLAAFLLSGAAAAGAQEDRRPVMIYDYAVNHPTEDAQMASSPSIGASVPATVSLATAEDVEEPVYGYFYYQGRPVIVELSTRSIVRIGN